MKYTIKKKEVISSYAEKTFYFRHEQNKLKKVCVILKMTHTNKK